MEEGIPSDGLRAARGDPAIKGKKDAPAAKPRCKHSGLRGFTCHLLTLERNHTAPHQQRQPEAHVPLIPVLPVEPQSATDFTALPPPTNEDRRAPSLSPALFALLGMHFPVRKRGLGEARRTSTTTVPPFPEAPRAGAKPTRGPVLSPCPFPPSCIVFTQRTAVLFSTLNCLECGAERWQIAVVRG